MSTLKRNAVKHFFDAVFGPFITRMRERGTGLYPIVWLIFASLLFVGSSANAKDTTPPKVFLDKSPRIVAYQLKRLDDDRLLLVPRSTDDAKYIPVYEAILSRPAIATGIRQEAIEALTKLNQSSVPAEILAAIQRAKPDDTSSKRLIDSLTIELLKQPTAELVKLSDSIVEAAESDDRWLARIGFAAFLTSGQSPAAASALAGKEAEQQMALMESVSLLRGDELRDALRPTVVATFQNAASTQIKAAAIAALAEIPSDVGDTFQQLTPLLDSTEHRVSAARALMQLPKSVFQNDVSLGAARSLVKFAESTPAADRTSDGFVDVMQVADRFLGALTPANAKRLRSRLREITVRVVKIGTVEEEMRYDVPYFAVEAGRPIQILLENHDLMPHNLVITTPGSLKGVALGGLAAGPEGTNGLPYVPDSPNVLAASNMISPDKTTRLTLTAPSEPGEYPYVCTFPQHWYRMYGVMVVVEDLDAWNQDPTEPANPIGSNRTFVQAWTVDDFEGAFDTNMRGRSASIGEKIFNEASCVGCHKVRGVGGVVGPELTDTYTKWKSDHVGILREILDPSHKVDSKYAMQTILTTEGKTVSGIVIAEDDDNITLLSNPESKEPMVIAQDDIEISKRSPTSMMPKALMDQYTKDEVVELMVYLRAMSTSN